MVRARRFVLTVAILALCGAFLECDGEPGGEVTLINQTPFWLHFFLPDEVILFVRPNSRETFDVADDNIGWFLVGTAPAQGVALRAQGWGSLCGCGACGSVTVSHGHTGLQVEVWGDSACSGSSCPYVYAHDGRGFVLEGESLTGAINQGAWRHDALVLPSLRADGGEYRVKVGAVLAERDHIDHVALELVDHPAATRLALDLQGTPWVLASLLPPRRARDANGRDQLAAVIGEDGRRWGSFQTLPTHDTLELELALPTGARGKRGTAMLLVVTRNAAFMERTYHRFMARFGPGWPAVSRRMSRLPGYRQIMADLARSAGLGMTVQLQDGTGWREAAWLPPVGSVADRVIGVPIRLPGGRGPVRIRLDVLPAAWEVDAVLLSPDPVEVPAALRHEIQARDIRLVRKGRLVAADRDRLAETDGRFEVLEQGDYMSLSFAQPPQPSGTRRTAVLRVAGYYEDLRQSSPLRFRVDRFLRSCFTEGDFERFAMEELRRIGPEAARRTRLMAHHPEGDR